MVFVCFLFCFFLSSYDCESTKYLLLGFYFHVVVVLYTLEH